MSVDGKLASSLGLTSGALSTDGLAPLDWPVLICVLGDFRVLKSGGPVAIRSGTKSEGLLTSLALGPERGATRDALLAALWPDHDPALASESLNSVIYRLHRLLGDALSGANPVVYQVGRYRLNTEAGVAVDVALVESMAKRGDALFRVGAYREAIDMYEAGISAYGGDVRAATDLQATLERERLRELASGMLARVSEFHFSAGDYGSCLKYALALLMHDPIREDTHRMAMRCYVRRGERAKALHQYRLCETVLRSEFDATPEHATTELFNQVRLDSKNI